MENSSGLSGALTPGYAPRERNNIVVQEVENGFIVSTHKHPYKQYVFASAADAAEKIKQLLLEAIR